MTMVTVRTQIDRNYQYELNGLLMGRSTRYLVQEIEGLDVPDIDLAAAARPNDHGGWSGRHLLRPRTVTIGLKVVDEDVENLELERRRIGEHLGLIRSERLPFIWRRPGMDEPRFIWAKVTRMTSPYGVAAAWSNVDVAIELRADDPRVYELLERTYTVEMAHVSGGRTYPKTYTMRYTTDEIESGGRASVENHGNFPVRPRVRLNGPFDNARIRNATTGKTLRIASGIPADDYLDIDFDNRAVLLNGEANRRYFVDDRSDWWELVPGRNDIHFYGATYDERASMFIRWRSAWLY